MRDANDTEEEYAAQGTKLVFCHPQSGSPDDQETARKHLTLGKRYTVWSSEMGRSYSWVVLEEVPGVRFNPVLFDEVAVASPKQKRGKKR